MSEQAQYSPPVEIPSPEGNAHQNEFYQRVLGCGVEQDVVPGVPGTIDLEKVPGMVTAINSKAEIAQELVGVIQLGGREGDKLAVVRVFDHKRPGQTHVTLNRIARDPDDRAEVVAVLTDAATDVGRTTPVNERAGFGDLVSRDHLGVSVKEGKVVIEDKNSTNGTKLVQSETGKMKLNELNSWSIKSADLRGMLDEAALDADTVPRDQSSKLRGTLNASSTTGIEPSTPLDAAPSYLVPDKNEPAQPLPQHEASKDPADQWWENAQVIDQKEAAAHPEIDPTEAEHIGEVALGTDVVARPADTVEEPIAPELTKPTAQEIFSDPSAIEKTLNDPDVDPQTKRDLQVVVSRWQELQKVDLTTEVWDKDIVPRLSALDVEGPQIQGLVRNTEHTRSQLQNGLLLLRNAIDGGNMQEIGDVARRANIGQLRQQMADQLRQLESNDSFSRVRDGLSTSSEEADSRIKKLVNKSDLSPQEAEAMATEFHEQVQAGASLDTLKAELEARLSEKRTPEWKKQKADVDDVLSFSNRVKNGLDLGSATKRMNQELDGLAEDIQRHRYDSAAFDQVARGRGMQELEDSLLQIEKMLRLTQDYSEQAARS